MNSHKYELAFWTAWTVCGILFTGYAFRWPKAVWLIGGGWAMTIFGSFQLALLLAQSRA